MIGKIHVYYGNGKGKTSILNGMCLRALGANLNVKYVRFLKNRPTSEDEILKKIGVTIENQYHSSQKFIWEMNETERAIFKQETRNGFALFCQYLQDDNVDIIMADEILGCIENNFISKQELIEALKNKRDQIEIVLSGRKVFTELINIADLVSNIEEIKHYFNTGTNSRKGIEY